MESSKSFPNILGFLLVMFVGTESSFALKFSATVIDASGRPIPEFEWMVDTARSGYTRWSKGLDGVLNASKPSIDLEKAELGDLIIRAKGYAPVIQRTDNFQTIDGKEFVMTKGRSIGLQVEPPPLFELPDDFIPRIVHPDYLNRVITQLGVKKWNITGGFLVDFVLPERTRDTHFHFHAPEDWETIYIVIDQPGILTGYISEPLAIPATSDAEIAFHVPKPSSLKVSFDASREPMEGFSFFGGTINLYHWPNVTEGGFIIASGGFSDSSGELEFTSLPPGRFWAEVVSNPLIVEKTFWTRLFGSPESPGPFRGFQEIEIEPGSASAVDIPFVPMNANRYEGNVSATIEIVRPNGEPPTGTDYEIRLMDSSYPKDQVVSKGSIPSSGIIHLDDLVSASEGISYMVRLSPVSDMFRLDITESTHQQFRFVLPPGVGGEAPDSQFESLETGNPVRVSDWRGQWVFMEFWETACGPCQQPMAKSAEILSRRKEKWKGKVQVVAASIDEHKEILESHIRKNGWEEITQVWSNVGGKGWESSAAKDFGVKGVPMALLIDPGGTIIWRGHPQTFDLEREIDQRLGIESE